MTNYPAWMNGKYCQLKDLTVSVLDLGFIHCDATYDVISARNKTIQNFNKHIKRLIDSAHGWRLPLLYTEHEIKTVVETLVSTAPGDDLLIWIGLTRGIPSSGSPRDLSKAIPNMFIYVKPYYGFNKDNTATVCLANQQRNTAIDQTMKNFAWNDLNLAQWEAIDRGYDTAILMDHRGFLTEGPGFNVGIIRDGKVYAPKHNRLDGTVMKLVEHLCEDNNIQFSWSALSSTDINAADAMFLTSTAGNVIAVKCFENKYFDNNEVLVWLQNNI
jgi:branched-chain amino acid aminotransferase